MNNKLSILKFNNNQPLAINIAKFILIVNFLFIFINLSLLSHWAPTIPDIINSSPIKMRGLPIYYVPPVLAFYQLYGSILEILLFISIFIWIIWPIKLSNKTIKIDDYINKNIENIKHDKNR